MRELVSGADTAVALLLRTVPEFVPHYLTLVAAADDDPGEAVAYEELAVFVSDLLERPEGTTAPCLARCLAAVEALAGSGPDGEELVTWTFLDGLSDSDRARLRPWMGPCTLARLGELDDVGGPDDARGPDDADLDDADPDELDDFDLRLDPLVPFDPVDGDGDGPRG